MPPLLRSCALKIIDRRYRKVLEAFARVDNRPVTIHELAAHYEGNSTALKDDIKSYGQSCERLEIGGHDAGRNGCTITTRHRVCSIHFGKRQRLVWLEHDFAGDALEHELDTHFDPVQMAQDRQSQAKPTRHDTSST